MRGGYGIYYTSMQYNELQFLMANLPNFAVENNSYTAAQPTPVNRTLTPNPASSTQAPFTVALKMSTTYVQQRNFSVQQAIGPRLVAEATYLGSNSSHLMRRLNPNQAYLPADPSNPASLQARRPYSWVGDVLQVSDSAAANYNGIEGSLRGEYGEAGSFFSRFVFSKSLDNATGEEQTPEDARNPQREYALSDLNRKYVFKTGGQVPVPILGRSHTLLPVNNTLLNEVFGGWRLSGVVEVLAGQPFTVTATDLSNTGAYHAVRPTRFCNGNVFPQRSRTRWFNTACYANSEVYQFGSAPRNDLIAPRNTKVDLSLFKTFPFGERRSFTFRTDAFSALNHPLPNAPNSNLNNANYGRIVSYGGARILQISMEGLGFRPCPFNPFLSHPTFYPA